MNLCLKSMIVTVIRNSNSTKTNRRMSVSRLSTWVLRSRWIHSEESDEDRLDHWRSLPIRFDRRSNQLRQRTSVIQIINVLRGHHHSGSGRPTTTHNYCVRSAIAHLGIWRKLYTTIARRSISPRPANVLSSVLSWYFRQSSTVWKLAEIWNRVFRPSTATPIPGLKVVPMIVRQWVPIS